MLHNKLMFLFTCYTMLFTLDTVLTIPSKSCSSRGTNCTSCLADGQCGFCDSCGDHCHQPVTESWDNCTGCAHCIPGNLAGPSKGWLYRVFQTSAPHSRPKWLNPELNQCLFGETARKDKYETGNEDGTSNLKLICQV